MFSNVNEIEALISRLMDKLDTSKTESVELEVADVKIKLSKHAAPPHHEPPHHHIMPMPHAEAPVMPSPMTSAPTAASEQSGTEPPAPSAATVNAPLLGVAYAAPSPDAAPFVKVGDRVKKGDIICIIEAMKVMNEIESDRDGEITKILFENGNMVEYGQPLVEVK